MKRITFFALPIVPLAFGLLLYGCGKSMQDPLSSDPTSRSLMGGSLAKDPAQTAQSAMIDIQGAGDFVVTNSEVWHFDQNLGANYFDATGGTATQQANAKKNIAQQQRCTFWNGGTLVSGTEGPVTVTPKGDGVVAAKTAWVLSSSSGSSTVDVTVNITIAGESFVLSKQFWPNGKYSFTLTNPDGSSRIENLTVTLSGDASRTDNPNHTLVDGGASFEYTGNAGANGTAKSYLKDGKMGDILTGDSFKGNDLGPYSIAIVDPITYTLGPGNYTITVTGTIKGVDGNASLSFSGTATTTISAEGCQ